MTTEVIFSEEKHEYRDVSGKLYPHVTGILRDAGVIDYSFIGSIKRETYLARGKRIHWLLQLEDENALNYRKVVKSMRGYRKAWNAWKRVSGFVPVLIEHPFIHLGLGYAGTIDRFGYFQSMPNIPVVVDIKTGVTIPDWVRLQVAAYIPPAGSALTLAVCEAIRVYAVP